MMNGLVCLASQFAKELANVDAFAKISSHQVPSSQSSPAPLPTRLSSIKNPSMLKVMKQQLFRGGVQNAQLLMQRAGAAKENDEVHGRAPTSSTALNYHDLIQQELKIQ